MNNPNPFIPQGSLLEQKNKKRARVKLAVYIIFGINILVLSPLLIQGCKKESPADNSGGNATTATTDTNTAANTVADTNPPASVPPLTNPPPTTNIVATPPPPPPQPPAVPTPTEYTIMKGDTFSTIAKKYSVKVKELEAANPNVAPTKLKVGEKITIPTPAGGATEGGTTAPTDMSGGEAYTVKSGDSLTKIAHEHGITIKALREANDLKTDKIKVGEKLKIPEKASAAAAPAPTPAPAPVDTTPAAAPAAPSNTTATPH